MSVRIGVLALQGDVREHMSALAGCGAEAVRVRRARELAQVDALVLPGGESTTIDKLLRAFSLAEPIRDRVRAGMPIYGSCAGMILLADRIEGGTARQQTLGGLDVVVRRNAFGRQVESFETDLDVVGLNAPLRAVFIRAPWVESVGAGVQVLARVDESAPAGVAGKIVAVRSGAILATAFHPEVTGDRRIHQMFVEMTKALA